MSTNFDYRITQGTTTRLSVELVDASGNPLDITNCIPFGRAERYLQSDYRTNQPMGFNFICERLSPVELGKIQITITPDMTWDIDVGPYTYSVCIKVATTGDIYEVLSGTLQIVNNPCSNGFIPNA